MAPKLVPAALDPVAPERSLRQTSTYALWPLAEGTKKELALENKTCT